MKLVILLAVICLLLADAELTNSEQRELDFYKDQISLTYDYLIAEGCHRFVRAKRQTSIDLRARIDIQKELSENLMKDLIECRKSKSTTLQIGNSTAATGTTPTTLHLQPIECQNAVNYTEPWRRDHLRSNFKPKGPRSHKRYACDLGVTSNSWFRFTGKAGNQMLNRCPKYQSCGSLKPLWTDEEMPTVVGMAAKVKAHGVGLKKCKAFTITVEAMRCSWNSDYDIIYKQTTNRRRSCDSAFCGMI